MDATDQTDPLRLLPSEIVLRILEFTSLSCLANLTRLSRNWHRFIDKVHQEIIYSAHANTPRLTGSKDFSFLQDSTSFSRYFDDITSWKDLCQRQTLLTRNWNRQRPITREATVRVGLDPIWRFRPDFKRRFILSTSHGGGLNVTDMDDGRLLWQLDYETVRAFAHLEYQDGTVVFDREGDAVEVWRADQAGALRGEFRRIAVLPHDSQTRGFQLSYDNLCVVSSEGKAYIYDMPGIPRQRLEMDIESGAVGHVDQNDDTMVCSLGTKGYHFFSKESGQLIGKLQPKYSTSIWHIPPASSTWETRIGSAIGCTNCIPPQNPKINRTEPLEVRSGKSYRQDPDMIKLEDDEWGAGMFSGDLFVGISRGGRVFVCPDWRLALESPQMPNYSYIVECDSDGSSFDFGGWLSVRDHRAMFEIQDQIYVLGLDDDDYLTSLCGPPRPSFAFAHSLNSRLAVPVSFMAIYDDCIMTTYTTLRYREAGDHDIAGQLAPRSRLIPTKAVRILSLAPSLAGEDEELLKQAAQDGWRSPAAYAQDLRTELYGLIDLLSDDAESEANSMAVHADDQQ